MDLNVTLDNHPPPGGEVAEVIDQETSSQPITALSNGTHVISLMNQSQFDSVHHLHAELLTASNADSG